MAPIRRFTNHVQAVGRIPMGLHTTNNDVLQPVTNVRQITDPFIKFVLGEYVAMERQRAEFFEMFGQLLEGVGINLSNLQTAMEDLDTDGTVDDTVLSGDVTASPSDTINDDVQPLAPRNKMKDLNFELVASKFGMPISLAAKELRISQATLAVWCRGSGIHRWPYKKIRSMSILLTNMKDYGKDEHFGDIGLHGAIKVVELEKEAIEKNPVKALQKSTLDLMRKMHNMSKNKKKKKKERREYNVFCLSVLYDWFMCDWSFV